MTFGRTLPRETDVRSLLEYTSPSIKSEKLAIAVSHLNMLRKMLQERDDFNMNQVISALGKKDTEGQRQLPLDEVINVLHKLSIPADAEKIRNAASHFQLFVDEGCCSEKVKYEELCDLLDPEISALDWIHYTHAKGDVQPGYSLSSVVCWFDEKTPRGTAIQNCEKGVH